MLFQCRGKAADGKPVLTEVEADDREEAVWTIHHSITTTEEGPVTVKWDYRTVKRIKPRTANT